MRARAVLRKPKVDVEVGKENENKLVMIVKNNTNEYLEIRGIEYYRSGRLSRVISILLSIIILLMIGLVTAGLTGTIQYIVYVVLIIITILLKAIEILGKRGYKKRSILDKLIFTYPLRSIITPKSIVNYALPLSKTLPDYIVVKTSKGYITVELPKPMEKVIRRKVTGVRRR